MRNSFVVCIFKNAKIKDLTPDPLFVHAKSDRKKVIDLLNMGLRPKPGAFFFPQKRINEANAGSADFHL
jgi:hypothetical protein